MNGFIALSIGAAMNAGLMIFSIMEQLPYAAYAAPIHGALAMFSGLLAIRLAMEKK